MERARDETRFEKLNVSAEEWVAGQDPDSAPPARNAKRAGERESARPALLARIRTAGHSRNRVTLEQKGSALLSFPDRTRHAGARHRRRLACG